MDQPALYTTAAAAVRGTDVKPLIIGNIKSRLPRVKAVIGGLPGKIPKARSYEPGHIHLLCRRPVFKDSGPDTVGEHNGAPSHGRARKE